jgi:hypothetical protein
MRPVMSLRGARQPCPRKRASNLNAANWLRLALFSFAPNAQGSLITHCKQNAYCQPAPKGIGFVFHGCPCLSFPAGISRSAIVGLRPQIGFVLHVSLPGHATPHTTTALPTYPIPPKFGFVLHNLLRRRLPEGQNLVRFAQSLSAGASRPGLPAPIPGRSARIGFVSHVSLPDHAPHDSRRCPTYPSRPKFGFVLHNLLCRSPPAGQNWVRFARFDPKLASFSTIAHPEFAA